MRLVVREGDVSTAMKLSMVTESTPINPTGFFLGTLVRAVLEIQARDTGPCLIRSFESISLERGGAILGMVFLLFVTLGMAS